MGRSPCCDKASVKRGPWSPEEDLVLKSYVEKHGTGGNWIALPQKAGLKRCGKSCRLRWLNYLRPDIKHGGFTEEEDNVICSLYKRIGSRWSVIASHLPGRTDNDVKNHWNTKLKKKLLMAGGRADAIASGGHSAPTRHSPSPSPPAENYAHGSFSSSACNGSSPSTLSSAEDTGFGFSEPASFALPANPLHPLSASTQDTSAATSSLAIDYSSSYAPWCDNGGAGVDAFLMDVGMGPMEFPNAGGYWLGELGNGETGMPSLWANAQSNPQGFYQSVTYL